MCRVYVPVLKDSAKVVPSNCKSEIIGYNVKFSAIQRGKEIVQTFTYLYLGSEDLVPMRVLEVANRDLDEIQERAKVPVKMEVNTKRVNNTLNKVADKHVVMR